MIRQQTAELGGIARINDSGVRILHPPARSGRWRSGSDAPRAVLQRVLGDRAGHRHGRGGGRRDSADRARPDGQEHRADRSKACWRSRARSARTRRTFRSSRRRRRCWRQIVDEAVIQDGYMNALTDGFDGAMSDTDLLILLSVVLAAVVVAVVAVALIEVRRGLTRISEGLATLGSALQDVESEHLRPLEPAVKAINAQFDIILGAFPGSPGKQRSWPSGDLDDPLVDRERRPARGRAPGRHLPAPRRARSRQEHRPERAADRRRRPQRGRRTSTRPRCC